MLSNITTFLTMKRAHQLLVMTAVVTSGLPAMVTDVPRSFTTKPGNAGGPPPAILNQSDGPTPTVQLNALQALDESVMTVMNDKTMSNEKKFAFFWQGYQKNKSSILLSTYYLDCLPSILPLPHIDQLLAELGNPMTAAEIKIHLMQVLQSSYLHENGLVESDRQFALDGIKANIDNTDPTVAGQAVLLYARMAAPDNLVRILADAFEQKIISPSDFIRENVFQLANVDEPQQQQALLATLIRAAQQNEADQSDHILTTTLGLIIQSPSRLARIDAASRNIIARYLMTHEPPVRSDGINYDLVSAIEYSDWLYSYAIIRSRSDADMLDWVTRQMTDVKIDTEKIVAVMNLPMASDVLRVVSQSGQLEGMKQKVERAMTGLKQGTAAYSAYEAALDILKRGN